MRLYRFPVCEIVCMLLRFCLTTAHSDWRGFPVLPFVDLGVCCWNCACQLQVPTGLLRLSRWTFCEIVNQNLTVCGIIGGFVMVITQGNAKRRVKASPLPNLSRTFSRLGRCFSRLCHCVDGDHFAAWPFCCCEGECGFAVPVMRRIVVRFYRLKLERVEQLRRHNESYCTVHR